MAAGGGRGTGRVLGCALAEVEAALLADSSPFLAELKAAQGGSAISVGAWQGFAGGGRVREVCFVQPVRARLSLILALTLTNPNSKPYPRCREPQP